MSLLIINETELNNEIASLLAKGEANQLDKTKIHTKEPQVCKSNVGHYIGRWCVEWLHNTWIPQPYERLSGYGTKEQMLKELKFY
jgi:hypothetical protein